MKGEKRKFCCPKHLYTITEDEEPHTSLEYKLRMRAQTYTQRSFQEASTQENCNCYFRNVTEVIPRERGMPSKLNAVFEHVPHLENQKAINSTFQRSRPKNLDAAKAIFPDFFPRGLVEETSSDICRPVQFLEKLFAREQYRDQSKEATSCQKNIVAWKASLYRFSY